MYTNMMNNSNQLTLTLCRGLPASGKTSWAKQQIARNPNTVVRVSRDDIRGLLFNKFVLDPGQENLVTKVQLDIIRDALVAKKNVIVDDTNLSSRTLESFYSFLEKFEGNVALRFQDFAVDIETCVQRDKKRELAGERFVGESVIRDIYKKKLHGGKDLPTLAAKFYQNITKPEPLKQDNTLLSAWVVDIDGTLAKMVNRGPFDWDLVDTDEPVEHVIRLVKELKNAGHIIILLSGRDIVCEEQTKIWLEVYDVPYDYLYMRPLDSTQPDHLMKRDFYNQFIKDKFFVSGILDDRNKVVEMWRKQGLFVAQVAPGLF